MTTINLKKIKSLFNARPERERLLILISSLALILFLWIELFLIPVSRTLKLLSEPIKTAKSSYHQINDQYTELLAIDQSPPNGLAFKNLQLKDHALRAKLFGLHTSDSSKKLILPYNRLHGFLQEVLAHQPGLRLEHLEDLPDTDSMQLEFYGNYFACISYLQHLENSAWYLFFDNFDYQVVSYPDAKISVLLHTPELAERPQT